MSLLFRRAPQETAERAMVWPFPIGPRSFGSTSVGITESMQSIAFRSGVDLIASLVSEAPLDVYSGQGESRRPRKLPGNLADPGGDGYGLQDWLYRLVTSWLVRGNAYGTPLEYDRNYNRATVVDLLYPDDVTVALVDDRIQWRIKGVVVENPRYNMWHRRVNPMPGVPLGLSPIELHAVQLGVSLSSSRFGQQWFTDGAHPSGMLTNSEGLTPEAAKTAKDRFMQALRGTREPVVLGKGWEFKSLQITPEESQFLETQGFSEAQAARILGPGVAEVLGYDSGGSMTYANVVDRSVHLLQYTINRWFNRAERVLNAMLPDPQWVRFSRDAMLQSTTLQRYQAHQLALSNKWKTINEVRDLEDMEPVEWGDEPVEGTVVPELEPKKGAENG